MLGFNGGLMGVRRTPTTGTASGLWFQNEQSVAKRANVWPFSQSADPYFSDVSLLLHMDGSNGSTTFTDSSAGARTVTHWGNSTISDAVIKFGNGSLSVNNSGATGVRCADTTAYNFGTSNFTVEGWWYITSSGSEHALFDIGGYIDGILLDRSTSTSRLIIKNTVYSFSTSAYLPLNQWIHVALTRASGQVNLWIDGASAVSATNTSNILPGSELALGVWGGVSGTYAGMSGYIDDFRVTKNIARYTSSFTPPTAPFPNQ
jgi:hypothetical protein